MANTFLDRIFAPGPAKAAGARLYESAVARSRQPALYLGLGAPDTVEGRFEIYSLHVSLLLLRLKGQGAPAAAVSQVLFDRFVSSLDHSLRELGVGDLTVGKKMRKLGEAFYGRVRSYEDALAALPDTAALEAVLTRTALDGVEGADPAPLAAYAISCRSGLAAQSTETLAGGQVTWPAP